MNVNLTRKLLVVSLSAFAIAASAENATPRDSSAAPTATTGAIQNGVPQTGTQLGDTMAPSTDSTLPAPTLAPGVTPNPMNTANPTDTGGARIFGAPANAPATVDGYARDRTQLDARCQKVSGSALDDCLKGADHGQ